MGGFWGDIWHHVRGPLGKMAAFGGIGVIVGGIRDWSMGQKFGKSMGDFQAGFRDSGNREVKDILLEGVQQNLSSLVSIAPGKFGKAAEYGVGMLIQGTLKPKDVSFWDSSLPPAVVAERARVAAIAAETEKQKAFIERQKLWEQKDKGPVAVTNITAEDIGYGYDDFIGEEAYIPPLKRTKPS